MRTIKILTMALLLVTGTSFTLSAQEKKGTKSPKTETVVYQVSLSCNNCKTKIEKHIPFEKGVRDVVVDVAAKTVTVTLDPRKTSKETILKEIEKLCFTASLKQ